MKYKRVIVKVGTNVLTREDELIDITSISQLVDQLAALKQQGVEVLLVSSGAVGAGRSMMRMPEGMSRVVRRQVLSAIGQVKLMELYRQLFSNYGLHCAQVLATKEDFRDRRHYLNMKHCLNALLRDNIIPVVNENDVVAIDELMFTDNDELAGLLAAMTNAGALIILSSVDGFLDGPPGHPDSKVIPEIDPAEKKWLEYILPSRSSFGRGGMHTKFRIAQKAAGVGIQTIIANGKQPHILTDIFHGQFTGTRFKARGAVSSLKKWLAYNELDHKGVVIINEGARKAVCSDEQVSSLLPVGIIRVEGDFKKGDLLRILDEQENEVGLGIAQYGAEKARQHLGKKGKKALVHYDYLYVEKTGKEKK